LTNNDGFLVFPLQLNFRIASVFIITHNHNVVMDKIWLTQGVVVGSRALGLWMESE